LQHRPDKRRQIGFQTNHVPNGLGSGKVLPTAVGANCRWRLYLLEAFKKEIAMRSAKLWGCLAAASLLGASSFALADDDAWGLKPGKVELKSAGPIAFGPDGILFVGDPTAASVIAVSTSDVKGNPGSAQYNIAGFQEKLADALGSKANQTQIADLAVNPATGNLYLSVATGEKRDPAIVRVNVDGRIAPVVLDKVNNSRVMLADAPESKAGGRGNPRDQSITDLTYVNGKLIVSGLGSSESAAIASTVREVEFPFVESAKGTNIEIYHAAHGRLESEAPVQTLAPLVIDGEATLLAGFTCTPLVKFPLGKVDTAKPDAGKKVRGTTVAELGNRNRPLDMIVYQKGGKDFVLMSNSARGVMKISTEKLRENGGLTEPVRGGGTAGQPYETIKELQGVEQLDRLDDTRAVVLAKNENSLDLRTIELP
jgi:hypothetical protein